MSDCAQGAFSRMLIKAGSSPYDWNSGATRLAYYREAVKRIGKVIHPDLIVGDRFEHAERARKSSNTYYGPITMAVSPADMLLLLPAITGGTFIGTNIELGASIPAYGYLIDKITEVFEYQNAKVDRCVIYGRQNESEDPSGESNQPNYLVMQLYVVAVNELPGVAFPGGTSLSVNPEDTPFIVEDCALTLAGSVRETKEFVLDINNHIKQRRVFNTNPSLLCTSRATVNLITTHPYDDDTDDLYDQAIAGAAGTLAVTNGTVGVTFNFPKLQVPPETPVVRGKTEVDIILQQTARMTGSSVPLNIDVDAVP